MIYSVLFQDKFYPSLQFLVFGSMAFTAGVFSTRLPETANQPMPETLDDLDVVGYDVKVTSLSDDKVRLLEDDIIEKQKERSALEEGRIVWDVSYVTVYLI